MDVIAIAANPMGSQSKMDGACGAIKQVMGMGEKFVYLDDHVHNMEKNF